MVFGLREARGAVSVRVRAQTLVHPGRRRRGGSWGGAEGVRQEEAGSGGGRQGSGGGSFPLIRLLSEGPGVDSGLEVGRGAAGRSRGGGGGGARGRQGVLVSAGEGLKNL